MYGGKLSDLTHDDLFLYILCFSHVSEQQWQDVSFNVELMRYIWLLIEKEAAELTNEAWDFILCSLIAWIQVNQFVIVILLDRNILLCMMRW